jgi:ABC-type glycerol-3-phosphate transport system substrate-binding protein
MSSTMRLAAGLLAAAVIVTGTAGCSGSPPGKSAAPSVTCTNYPIQGTGTFHDEVQVQVTASNSTGSPANYQADVIMTLAGQAAAGAPVHVLVNGLVPAGSSAVLRRKVLVASKARDCKISDLSRS